MQREIPTPIGTSAVSVGTWGWLRPASILVAGSLLLAVCARLSLPLNFIPVPLSLQPFGVLLLGLLLSPRMAVSTVCTYLVEGACGLPVFATTVAGTAGMTHLLGPTGGYLLAYPVAAGLTSLLWRRSGRGFSTALASAALGDLLILTCGAIWLAAGTHVSAASTITSSLLAFIPGDALKVVAAAGIAFAGQRARKHTGR
jgi:biotin transport system substrate-specific component